MALAAGRKRFAGSLVGRNIVCIVTQFADLLAQLIGISFAGIVVDGQLGRFHIIGIGLHALEVRDVFTELVGTFLTDAVGLDHHRLDVGLLSEGAQAEDSHNG